MQECIISFACFVQDLCIIGFVQEYVIFFVQECIIGFVQECIIGFVQGQQEAQSTPHALGSQALKLFRLLNSAPVVYFRRSSAPADRVCHIYNPSSLLVECDYKTVQE